MKADIRTFNNIESLSRAAADVFTGTAAHAVRTRGRFFVTLSGGSTPSRLYSLLAEEPYRRQIEWSKTFIFWGDERCVPPEEEGSNYHQAHETLLKHVPIPDRNVLRIKGELPPEEVSNAYTHTLKHFADPGLDWPRFDLVLLGMGADGHTASLFPGTEVEVSSPVLSVSADYQGRPAQRVTLTPPVFNSARLVLFLVAGADKAGALQHVLSDASLPEQYPAQRIRPADGQVIWLVDDAAAANL